MNHREDVQVYLGGFGCGKQALFANTAKWALKATEPGIDLGSNGGNMAHGDVTVTIPWSAWLIYGDGKPIPPPDRDAILPTDEDQNVYIFETATGAEDKDVIRDCWVFATVPDALECACQSASLGIKKALNTHDDGDEPAHRASDVRKSWDDDDEPDGFIVEWTCNECGFGVNMHNTLERPGPCRRCAAKQVPVVVKPGAPLVKPAGM